MKDVSKELVQHVAHLARLKLENDSVESYQQHMIKVLNYMEELNELDVSDLPPLISPVRGQNVIHSSQHHLRADEIKDSVSTQEILMNAPQSHLNQFKVEAIIEDV